MEMPHPSKMFNIGSNPVRGTIRNRVKPGQRKQGSFKLGQFLLAV